MFDEMRHAKLHDLTLDERAIFAEVCGFSCQMPESIAQLCRSVEYLVGNEIAGDIVECGVYLGASIVAVMRTLQRLGAERDIWLYDTFEGMPKPQALDQFCSESSGDAHQIWEDANRDGSGWVKAELDAVKTNLSHVGYPQERVHFVKGLVEDTIPSTMPDKIALLRLDTDFYSSTKHELVHLFPRVVSGGVVIVDDYGAFKGSKQATDEYLREQGLKVLLSRIDEHVRLFVKP
jgi:hypothetical protein